MGDIFLTPGEELWLKEHLSQIETKIREEAIKLSDAANRSGMIEPLDVAEAARRYAPGTLLPMQPVGLPPQGFWSRVTESISGITLISALLAFIFGTLGLLKPNAAQGWLDIAKIFAGAVVGSAGASVAAAVRGK